MTNGKDRLAAALGESYPRVWRGLGLESKTGRNLPDIQDKKRPRADASPTGPYPRQLGQHVVLSLPQDRKDRTQRGQQRGTG